MNLDSTENHRQSSQIGAAVATASSSFSSLSPDHMANKKRKKRVSSMQRLYSHILHSSEETQYPFLWLFYISWITGSQHPAVLLFLPQVSYIFVLLFLVIAAVAVITIGDMIHFSIYTQKHMQDVITQIGMRNSKMIADDNITQVFIQSFQDLTPLRQWQK